MNEATEFTTARQDNPEGPGEITTAPTASNSVSPRSRDDALTSTLFHSVAVWINEGGAGGEVIR